MSSQQSIQVLAVESNDDNRLALEVFFAAIPDLFLAAVPGDLSRALQWLADNVVDVVLVDLGSRQEESIAFIRRLRQSHPRVKVIVLTASDTPEDIFSAMDAGADGYVLKGSYSKALEMAIRSVRLGAVWLDPGIARQVLTAIESASMEKTTRTLPTGLMTIPLLPDEKSILSEVAASNCVDGVCMVDPSFLLKLRRFCPSGE